jgi:hypothetical protein
MKRTMPIYDGAWHATDAVRHAGAELWLTTTRPYMRLDNVDPDTRFWLELHRFEYYGLLYDEDKYRMLMDIVGRDRIVGVLEDDPELYDRAEELGLPVWLIQRQHNRHVVKGRMVATLADAVEQFKMDIERWHHAQQHA